MDNKVFDAEGNELHIGDRVVVGDVGLDFNVSTIGKEGTVVVLHSGGYEVGLLFDDNVSGGHSLGGRVDNRRGYYGCGAQVSAACSKPVEITVGFDELFGDI